MTDITPQTLPTVDDAALDAKVKELLGEKGYAQWQEVLKSQDPKQVEAFISKYFKVNGTKYVAEGASAPDKRPHRERAQAYGKIKGDNALVAACLIEQATRNKFETYGPKLGKNQDMRFVVKDGIPALQNGQQQNPDKGKDKEDSEGFIGWWKSLEGWQKLLIALGVALLIAIPIIAIMQHHRNKRKRGGTSVVTPEETAQPADGSTSVDLNKAQEAGLIGQDNTPSKGGQDASNQEQADAWKEATGNREHKVTWTPVPADDQTNGAGTYNPQRARGR